MKPRIAVAFMFVFLAANVAAQSPAKANSALEELAAAEREFAAFTVSNGFRDGFIKYFADDGIGFGPHPERTREKLMKSPPAAGPRALIFNWAPMFGDISASGDMGCTTGPVLFTDVSENPKPPRHGIYFSVWQKQADGSWKVAIDMGVDTPEPAAPIDTKFTHARPPDSMPKSGSNDDYRKLDLTFWSAIFRGSPVKAYHARLDKQFRIHRTGIMPITDRTNLRSAITQTRFDFIDGKIAASNDLAFTYGKYATVNKPGGEENGYYVHVWRRDSEGKWRLAADVQNPLPNK